MRIIPFLISLVLTVALIIALDNKWGSIPPLGKFLSPQQGFWQNAEAKDHDFSGALKHKSLKGVVNVYFDERLVPHVFADHDEDLYFVQGFLHAKFRLWQMEFQGFAAAGRLSEVLGNNERLIAYDRLQRRMGMVYGAENELKAVAAEPSTQKVYNSYTAGVNAFINSLSESTLPLEYKLLDYRPELWSNLKIALFFKLMSSDLAGLSYARDIEFTNARSVFTKEEMEILYPQISDSSMPIVPKGTSFAPPSVTPTMPAMADSFFYDIDTVIQPVQVADPIDLRGSNNWAVRGAKTKSGAPILCNDPHLRLTLPSIWYEMQLHTPSINVYGVGFPSVPGIVIGFNDSIAFGLTNAGRDVIDYYEIKFKDDSRKQYWYNGAWQDTHFRVETVKIRDSSAYIDSVAYTVFGPVLYDKKFTGEDSSRTTALAMRWIAHDSSNEALTLHQINRARNYDDYAEALKGFQSPAQNIVFASKAGDIAIWQQGKFPARWQKQGVYVMPGQNSDFSWQGYIPQQENPHVYNPAENFVQSANQRAVDSAYPYFIPGDYHVPRGRAVHHFLSRMHSVTPKDMMNLQMSSYSSLAKDAVPLLITNIYLDRLSDQERLYFDELQRWNYEYDADSRAAVIFQQWIDTFEVLIWKDDFSKLKRPYEIPDEQTLIELLLRDSSSRFVDDSNTAAIEDIRHQVTTAFKGTVSKISKTGNQLVWWKHRNTAILHLLRDALFTFGHSGINAGGWSTTPNALSAFHGPSWRMVVHLTTPTEAYGIFPGGQSGNPGSRFYDDNIAGWTAGKYNNLWMMNKTENTSKRIKWKLSFSNT
jgi:penicillin amidase